MTVGRVTPKTVAGDQERFISRPPEQAGIAEAFDRLTEAVAVMLFMLGSSVSNSTVRVASQSPAPAVQTAVLISALPAKPL